MSAEIGTVIWATRSMNVPDSICIPAGDSTVDASGSIVTSTPVMFRIANSSVTNESTGTPSISVRSPFVGSM